MNINENWNWVSHKIYQAYSKNWSFYQTSIEHKRKSELGFSQNPPNYQVGFPKFDLFLKPALNIKKIGTGFLTSFSQNPQTLLELKFLTKKTIILELPALNKNKFWNWDSQKIPKTLKWVFQNPYKQAQKVELD